MYAVLGQYIRVLWGFQQDSHLLSISNHADSHHQSKSHEHPILPTDVYHYEFTPGSELIHQPSLSISQLPDDRHNSYNVDNGVITDKLNRDRREYVHSLFPTIDLSIIDGTQSLISVARKLHHLSPVPNHKFRKQHTWGISKLHNAPS